MSKPGTPSRTPSEHQNSWDLWMFIPLKMVLIGIDPYPYILIYGQTWWFLHGAGLSGPQQQVSALVARQLVAWAKAPEVEAGPCFGAQLVLPWNCCIKWSKWKPNNWRCCQIQDFSHNLDSENAPNGDFAVTKSQGLKRFDGGFNRSLTNKMWWFDSIEFFPTFVHGALYMDEVWLAVNVYTCMLIVRTMVHVGICACCMHARIFVELFSDWF